MNLSCRSVLRLLDSNPDSFLLSSEPLRALTFSPPALLPFAVIFDYSTDAVLLSILPLAIVYAAAICPVILSMPMSLVVLEFALISFAIGPLHDTFSMHFVFMPPSMVFFTILPYVFALKNHQSLG